MRTILAACFVLFLFLSVSAQKKMTDREFDGFKGNVKTVSIETMPLSDSRLKNKRVVWEKWSYGTDGGKTEENNPQGKSKMIFSIKNGAKTASSITSEGGSSETFNYKYLYEYDADGRVKTERIYFNNNKTPSVKTFKYDARGRIIEKTSDDPSSSIKTLYKYNDKGELVEQSEDQKGKSEFGTNSKSRTVYTEYKFDAQGNWIQRKSTLRYESGGEATEYVSMDYQVFTYYE